MFSRILGKKTKKKDMQNSLEEKVSKMNITEMRSFVNNKAEITEEGLVEVLKKLLYKENENARRYIELDDADVKIKKGFELVIVIAGHKKITIEAIELIVKFIELYGDIIHQYDELNKQIYKSKLKDSLSLALKNLGEISDAKEKQNLLDGR